jgi:hypothetical protein
MELSRIAERVARRLVAGEDWMLSDDIKKLLPQVVQEIRRRRGSATLTGGKIVARRFVLDPLHSIPLEIRLWEGTYYPGKVLVDASFGGGHPVPVMDRQPFDAGKVVDSIAEAFMSLVNYKREARADDLGIRSDSADAVVLPGLNEELDLLENQPHKMWTAASELLVIAKELAGAS